MPYAEAVLVVEADVDSQIDELVKAQVSSALSHHIPKDLQDELEGRQMELAEIQRALHNS